MDRLLRDELIRDEGIRLEAYQDTNGFWTIGVGHLLGTEKRMSRITAREADALLATDVEDAEKLVREVFGKDVVDRLWCGCQHRMCDVERARYRALVNMAFNRGGHMKTSTTITPAIKQALIDGNWAPVTAAIKASPWAKQIGRRADRIAQMLEKGEVT